MTFSEIIAEARRLSKANSNSYSLADIVTSANKAVNHVVALIRDSEGRWQWDDSNNSDFPISTTALVANQQDYSLGSTQYRIERLEVKDENGDWTLLTPIDQADVNNQSLSEFYSTAGTPRYYDKIGNSLFLYPAPSYSQAASLKLYHERGPSYFTVSDTSKEPGFNPLFHSIIPMWCAYDQMFIKRSPDTKDLREEIERWEQKLVDYYSLRNRDEHCRLTTRQGSFR